MKRALLIGIEYQSYDSTYIPGCYNDVLLMRDVLKNKFNFSTDDITILSDNLVENKYLLPTAENIYKALSNIVSESDKCSQIVIHYSGHGKFIADTTGDEVDFKDEVIVPMDYKVNGVISDDQINALIRDVKCPTLLLFDCCHSGTICDLPFSWNQKQNNYQVTVNNNSSNYPSNIIKLSSSLDNEVSLAMSDLAGVYYGVFTKNLVYELYGMDTKKTTLKVLADKINTSIHKLNVSQTVNVSSSNQNALNMTFFDLLGELEVVTSQDINSLHLELSYKNSKLNSLTEELNGLKNSMSDLNTRLNCETTEARRLNQENVELKQRIKDQTYELNKLQNLYKSSVITKKDDERIVNEKTKYVDNMIKENKRLKHFLLQKRNQLYSM